MLVPDLEQSAHVQVLLLLHLIAVMVQLLISVKVLLLLHLDVVPKQVLVDVTVNRMALIDFVVSQMTQAKAAKPHLNTLKAFARRLSVPNRPRQMSMDVVIVVHYDFAGTLQRMASLAVLLEFDVDARYRKNAK